MFSCAGLLCLLRRSSGVQLDLHSFPTRRSSDLDQAEALRDAAGLLVLMLVAGLLEFVVNLAGALPDEEEAAHDQDNRSEEHTSELQSHSDLVCRLLLEKNDVIRLHRAVNVRLHY